MGMNLAALILKCIEPSVAKSIHFNNITHLMYIKSIEVYELKLRQDAYLALSYIYMYYSCTDKLYFLE